MLPLRLGRDYIRKIRALNLSHHPDLILYNMDETQYQDFWQGIKTHPKTQLSTNGIQIKKVSWLGALFQEFKGWLGFDNRCHPNKIEMTLAKVAYYGYLKGYSIPEDNPHTFLSTSFKDLVNLPRSSLHSAQIQHSMLNYYKNHTDVFPSNSYPVNENTFFGQTLLDLELYEHVPSLDPQSPQIISQTIDGLKHTGVIASTEDYLVNSPFAAAYAESLVQQKRYLQALEWAPNIFKKHKEEYINFYLSREQHDPEALAKAMELLNDLAGSSNTKEQSKAVQFIKDNFDWKEQRLYLAPYKELKKKIAQTYLSSALQEHNKYLVTKYFIGNDTLPLLAHAVQLDPQLFDHSLIPELLPLKQEWLIYCFSEALLNNRFSEARTLFEQNNTIKYNQNHLMLLKKDYELEIHEKTYLLKEALRLSKVELAQTLALELIGIAKKISIITPQDNPLLKMRINYASTLVAIDEINHPNPAEADITVLDKAQKEMEEHLLLNPSTSLKQELNHLLLRKIDYFMEQVKGPVDFGRSWKERTAFAEEHTVELGELQKLLMRYIALNEKDKNTNVRTKIAKMHYILADILEFFLDNKNDALIHFSAAHKLMPKNPYYEIRHLNLTNNDRRHKVQETIDTISSTNATDYQGWLEERWNSGEKSIGRGFEIHNTEVASKGLFSFLY